MSDQYLFPKLLLLFLVMVLAFVPAILPTKIKKLRENSVILGIGNAFSGGIFLGIALLHMLPETTHEYEELKDEHEEHEEHEEEEDEHKHEFNLVFFLVFIGYLMILVLEKVVFKIQSLRNVEAEQENKEDRNESMEPIIKANNNNSNPDLEEPNEESKDPNEINLPQIHNTNPIIEPAKIDENDEENHAKERTKSISNKNNVSPKEDKTLTTIENSKSDQKLAKLSLKQQISKTLTPIALMIALSVHSIIAGVAVGISDESSEIWTLTIAILLHKPAAALSLGISLVKFYELQKLWLMYTIILIFTFATPLGVVIGILASDGSDWTGVVLNSIAIGNFIYLGASHIVADEFTKGDFRWTKITVFTLGALFIMLVTLIEIH